MGLLEHPLILTVVCVQESWYLENGPFQEFYNFPLTFI